LLEASYCRVLEGIGIGATFSAYDEEADENDCQDPTQTQRTDDAPPQFSIYQTAIVPDGVSAISPTGAHVRLQIQGEGDKMEGEVFIT